MSSSKSLWLIDSAFNAVPGIQKASIKLLEPRAPEDGIPVTLMAKHQLHIHAVWMLGHHEMIVCCRWTGDQGIDIYAYDHYSTVDAKGFYFSEVNTILDTYVKP